MTTALLFYGLPFLVSFAVSLAGAYYLSRRCWATRGRACGPILKRRITRLGGVAIIAGFLTALAFHPSLAFSSALFWVLLGGSIVALTGILDDFYDWPAWAQLTGQLSGALVAVSGGISLGVLNNPAGGPGISLDWWLVGPWAIPEALVLVLWLVVMMNALNWLDGLDGLAASTGLISALALFGLSLLPSVNQPSSASLAIILAGALAGFLVLNWPPAKIFLGTTGSTVVGFLIGALAIMAGSKLATALMVLAVPVIDALMVLWLRIKSRHPLTRADFRHIHFRLRRRGLSERRILAVLLGLTTLFGAMSVAAPSGIKGLLLLIMILAMVWQIIKSALKKNGV